MISPKRGIVFRPPSNCRYSPRSSTTHLKCTTTGVVIIPLLLISLLFIAFPLTVNCDTSDNHQLQQPFGVAASFAAELLNPLYHSSNNFESTPSHHAGSPINDAHNEVEAFGSRAPSDIITATNNNQTIYSVDGNDDDNVLAAPHPHSISDQGLSSLAIESLAAALLTNNSTASTQPQPPHAAPIGTAVHRNFRPPSPDVSRKGEVDPSTIDAPYSPAPVHNNRPRARDSHRIPSGSAQWYWYWCFAGILVLFAGFASGLTVGFMSIDPVQLKVLESEGTPEQKRGLRQVSEVIRRHHLLLVTLLLANSVAMETLPIFLDRLVPSWAAVLLSVTAILLFGEIIPQALCTGPNQLAIAQTAAPFVSLLIGLLFIISWPIAKLLDYLLGDVDHHSYYARAHLKALIRMHERDRRIKEATDHGAVSDASSALGADEVVVIEGALDLALKTVGEIMLPIENVFMLEVDTKLNRQTFELILHSGHSRIPVYKERRNNIKGLLLTKSLLAIDPGEEIRAGDLLVARRPIFSTPDTNLYDLLNEFQKGHSHIAFVTNQADGYIKAFKTKTEFPENCTLMGIATLEDVIEELIQEEIYDEFDEKAVVKASPSETPLPTSSVASISNAITNSRKRSSHLLVLTNEVPPVNPTADTFPISNSGRDLPEIVKQLSQDFQVASSDKPSSKRFGPSSAQMDSFPLSMTVPLVTSSHSRGSPPASSSVIFASSTTPSLSSKVATLVLMDELNRGKKVPSSQRIKTYEEDGSRGRRITTRRVKSRSSTWSENPETVSDNLPFSSEAATETDQSQQSEREGHRQYSSPPLAHHRGVGVVSSSASANNSTHINNRYIHKHSLGSSECNASGEDVVSAEGSQGTLSPREEDQEGMSPSPRGGYYQQRGQPARYLIPPSDHTTVIDDRKT